MRRLISVAFAFALSFTAPAIAAAPATLLPAGSLRATFIATNPVQATIDPRTGQARGPAADLARELGKKLSVPVKVSAAEGVRGVLDSVKKGEADIGFLAYDSGRAAEVDFSQPYSLGQNTFIVLTSSPLRSVREIDRPGTRVGATGGDAGELFLTRTLKSARIERFRDGDMEMAMDRLRKGELQAYGTNRQRLFEIAARASDLRLLPDNFYAVEQSVIVKKGNKALLEVVTRFLDEARISGFVADSMRRSGLVGVDVARPRPGASR
jgi:polar amino acid transport system substrate-binding protein